MRARVVSSPTRSPSGMVALACIAMLAWAEGGTAPTFVPLGTLPQAGATGSIAKAVSATDSPSWVRLAPRTVGKRFDGPLRKAWWGLGAYPSSSPFSEATSVSGDGSVIVGVSKDFSPPRASPLEQGFILETGERNELRRVADRPEFGLCFVG